MTWLGIIMTSALVLGLLFLYFIYVTTPKNSRKSSHRDKGISPSEVAPKWAEVKAMMQQGGPANYKQSIMEADKLVDRVLVNKVSGETMGERLKNAKHLFSKDVYDSLWTAHKIRNKVAHDPDFEGLASDATVAIRYFEQALRELKVL